MRAHFGGSSRKSLVASRVLLDAAVKGVDAHSASALSSELFFVADVLSTNISVRRALTDPSRDGKAKAAFISELFGKKIGAGALGLVTVGSLIVAGALLYLSVLVLGEAIGFTLTLAGIAGAIVSIGITADSFIVYFERIRDEAREGRTLRSAVESGWVKARHTIIVADTVSILAAVLLYFFAVGGVRGFAFTLGLVTIIDLLVVFIFTKPLVTLIAKTHFFSSGHPASGFSAKSIGSKQPIKQEKQVTTEGMEG